MKEVRLRAVRSLAWSLWGGVLSLLEGVFFKRSWLDLANCHSRGAEISMAWSMGRAEHERRGAGHSGGTGGQKEKK